MLIRKKGNITIHVDDIEYISYDVPNYWLVVLCPGGSTPKAFRIHLKREINGGKVYCLIIKYKDVLKLQKFFQKEIYMHWEL